MLAQTVAPLDLQYKPDAAEARQHMRAYWKGEIIDRACISVRAPKDGKVPPRRPAITAADFDFFHAIAEFEAWAERTFFGGESMPAFMPNWGPDQWAAFIGAKITLSPETDTSWVEPIVWDWNKDLHLSIDEDNRWWKGILDLTRQAVQRCEGKYIISTIDTHSNLDCLSALRGPAQLCVDLLDNSEAVLRAIKAIDALYKPVYDAIYGVGRMSEFGTTSWLDMWSDGKSQAVQCDFCAMISPEHFRRFVLPSIEHEISLLDHAVYHLDGVGQIPHLDDLLAIPRLHTIQWVPGAGQPSAPAWVELLRKIQKAGKSVQVLVTPEEFKAVYSQLVPEKAFYWILDCAGEADACDLIRWAKAHVPGSG